MLNSVSLARVEAGVILTMRDVFKIYKENDLQTVALRGVNLEVKSGEFVAVIGRSGSGKSTLFGVIAGLIEPSAGKVELAGFDVTTMPENQRNVLRRKCIGVTFQRDNLLPFLTALENVTLPLQLAAHQTPKSRATELLHKVGLGARLQHKASQLSGGEQARVALAVALANQPSLLLADEPTGELDTATSEVIMLMLKKLNAEHGLTVLVVTHNPEVAARANRVVQITDGALAEQGNL